MSPKNKLTEAASKANLPPDVADNMRQSAQSVDSIALELGDAMGIKGLTKGDLRGK